MGFHGHREFQGRLARALDGDRRLAELIFSAGLGIPTALGYRVHLRSENPSPPARAPAWPHMEGVVEGVGDTDPW